MAGASRDSAPAMAAPRGDRRAVTTQPQREGPAGTQPRRRPWRSWNQLSPQERRIVHQIAKALGRLSPEKRTAMLRALNRYRRWLASLPPEQQQRVLRMPPGKRLAYMRMFVKLHPPEQIIPLGDPPAEPGELEAEPFYADDWDPQLDQREAYLQQLRAFFDRLELGEKKRLMDMWPERQERELRRLFYRREVLLVQLRRFFRGLDARHRRDLWRLPPEEQERRLRWMFARRQQMMRTEFFHRVLTPTQRRHILDLGRRSPAEAERLFQQWFRQHQSRSSQPTPASEIRPARRRPLAPPTSP